MSTTYRQDADFLEAIISQNLLEKAIAWIKSNLEPHDVFDEDQLRIWAEDYGYDMVDEY